ncbi:YbaN family protein [Pseudorhodobacter wandonensis]|uniref:YbaN family protein n=1 Tax=Pseudorhodobacter wandonensis TaxID=1120568 RepID=UPI00067DF82C|nr:YbaN family protein [Pseudorhodobacter wandonensis]
MPRIPHHKGKHTFVTLWAWRVLGGVSLLLGLIGVVLPLLPTTPFVMLAAFAFAKSAPNLHKKLLQSRTFGPLITKWEQKGAIAPRHKAMAVGMMAAAFGAAVLFGAPFYALAIQVVCMGGAAIYVVTRPSG